MDQLTFDQILARIDREKAATAVAHSVVYLGGLLDWGVDEFMAVQETLFTALPEGLPSVGDQDDEALKFWGTISLEVGNDCDYDPDEQDEEPVSPANERRVVFYTNESFYEADSGSYVVAKITEDEAGYEVWARVHTLEAAKLTAAAQNEAIGVDDDVLLTVVASSMRQGNRSWE